jgi:diketogulonate reductase-like aldo/keto reductase
MSGPTVKLNDGKEIPIVGLGGSSMNRVARSVCLRSKLIGTWQSPKGEVAKAVEYALQNGYRHIDGAL